MFVLDLTYHADLVELDALLPAHREYLARHYAAGTFLVSGRKVPRTGGIILAHGERETIEKIIEEDPFLVAGLVTYAVAEFVPTMTCPELAAYQRELP